MTHPLSMLGDRRADPLDNLAYQALAHRAADAFEIALHYQGACTAEARQEAPHNALATAAPGLVAAALVRLADDPGLGLTIEQREYLTDMATGLDLLAAVGVKWPHRPSCLDLWLDLLKRPAGSLAAPFW